MQHPPSTYSDIVIVGAGFSGLSCGLLLAKAGYAVTLLEAAPQAGGRARAIQRFSTQDHQYLDNGPHLIMGAYHHFFKLLNFAGVSVEGAFHQSSFSWSTDSFHLQLGQGSMISAMLQAIRYSYGLQGKEIWALLRLQRVLFKKTLVINHDLSVTEWLRHLNMPPRLIKQLWIPLCLSALNTNPDEASAYCFVHILRLVFSQGSAGWQMYWSRCDLSSLYVQPFIKKIKAAGGNLLTNQRVRCISRLGAQSGYSLQTSNAVFKCQHVILALPVWQTIKVLSDSSDLDWSTRKVDLKNLSHIASRPIASVYVTLPNKPEHQSSVLSHFPAIYLQCFNGYSIVWLSQRRWRDDFFDQGERLAPSLTAIYSCHVPKNLSLFTRQAFENLMQHRVLNALKMDIAEITLTPIYEHQATPLAGIQRDAIDVAFLDQDDSVWLCGDYLLPHLPGTLETAAHSAFEVTQKVLEQKNSLCEGQIV